jgi:Cysteine-rich secretory protein family
MFHVKHLLVFLFLLPLVVAGQSQFSLQDKRFAPSVAVDQELMEYVSGQTKGRGLTEEEQRFFYWSNFLRQYPKRFYLEIIDAFLKEFPEAKGREAESLKKELLALSSLPKYRFSSLLADLSLEHANDLAEHSNQISHTDSKGRSFGQRMKLGGVTKCAAENIYTGMNDGLLSLIMLLLDIGLESAGHRKNILNPALTNMGFSIRPHQTGQRIILVQIFGCN